MKITFKYTQHTCTPMEYDDVLWHLDRLCEDLSALKPSGRLRIHNRVQSELGAKMLPITSDSLTVTEERYQALLNAREILLEVGAACKRLPLEKDVLDQQRDNPANDSGEKRKAKLSFGPSDVLAIIFGSVLGGLFAKLLCLLCGL